MNLSFSKRAVYNHQALWPILSRSVLLQSKKTRTYHLNYSGSAHLGRFYTHRHSSVSHKRSHTGTRNAVYAVVVCRLMGKSLRRHVICCYGNFSFVLQLCLKDP